jgi:hypothetical protein
MVFSVLVDIESFNAMACCAGVRERTPAQQADMPP